VTPDFLQPYAIAVLSVAIIPSLGYLVNSTIVVKARLQAHEATDAVRFDDIQEALQRLEHGQNDTNKKLDRLIERRER
jgi:hypothetical protein